MSNSFTGSENLHVSGDRTIAWETVREHIKTSAKEMLLLVNKGILNYSLLNVFRVCRSIKRT